MSEHDFVPGFTPQAAPAMDAPRWRVRGADSVPFGPFLPAPHTGEPLFRVDGEYAQRFWTPTMGPTAMAILRTIWAERYRFHLGEQWFHVERDFLAAAVGVNERRLRATLTRLDRFGVVGFSAGGEGEPWIMPRLWLPRLTASARGRLHPRLAQEEHEAYTKAGGDPHRVE